MYPPDMSAAMGELARIEPLPEGAGLRIAGEIDLANHDRLRQALARLPAGGDVHLDLSGLHFIDVAGAAELVDFANGPPPRIVLLHSPPPQLGRIIDLLWPELEWGAN